jgi:hypothetical protein
VILKADLAEFGLPRETCLIENGAVSKGCEAEVGEATCKGDGFERGHSTKNGMAEIRHILECHSGEPTTISKLSASEGRTPTEERLVKVDSPIKMSMIEVGDSEKLYAGKYGIIWEPGAVEPAVLEARMFIIMGEGGE